MPAIKDTLLEKLNQQIDNELHASHLYLAMSGWFEDEDLTGFAAWMRAQADEEREHAMKFYDHICHRGSKVSLGAIEEPKGDWKGPAAVFKEALAHEQEVTKQIYELYEEAKTGKDYGVEVFLHWFVSEQMEEEDTFATLLARIKRAENDAAALMILDKELEERAAAGGA